MVELGTAAKSRLDHVLAHAARGFFVFPLKPNSKEPAVRWKEWATRNPQKIKAYWSKHPDHNIAIATGPSGLIALDVDVKRGKRGEESLRLLDMLDGVPVTLEQVTPTGGRHLLYRSAELVADGVNVFGADFDGIDIRSADGYVVAAGSEIEGKPYEMRERPIAECPAWLLAQCKRPRSRVSGERPKEPRSEINQEAARRRAIEYLEAAEPAVEGAGGNRHTFTVACNVRDFGVGEQDCWGLMLDHWNDRCVPPWLVEELQTPVRNAYRYAHNEIGSRAPEGVFEAVPSADDEASGEEEAARRSRLSKKTEEKRFRIEMLSEVTIPTEHPQLVDGMLDHSALSSFYGPSNEGKSFVALHLAFCVASGQPFFGRKVEQGGALYFAAEGANGMRRRLAALRKFHGVDQADLPLGLVASPVDLSRSGEDVHPMIDAIREFEDRTKTRVKIIVVDTVSRALNGGDENSSTELPALVDNVNDIQATTNVHALLIHHSGKDLGKGSRGHTSFRAALDCEFEVNKGTITSKKMRDSEFPKPMAFAIKSVEIARDSEGKPITSAVLVPLSASDAKAAFAPIAPKRGTVPDTALELLRQLQAKGVPSRDVLLEAVPRPRGDKVVPIAEWRSAMARHPRFSKQSEATRRSTLHRALRGIEALIHVEGEYLYEPEG